MFPRPFYVEEESPIIKPCGVEVSGGMSKCLGWRHTYFSIARKAQEMAQGKII
jgi:hypothetical protein